MATGKREMNVLISGNSINPTRIDLQAGKFNLTIDEPKTMGGTDAGPSPIEVLLMSLAGCLNVTGYQVAQQKGLKLNGMKIEIAGVLNPCTFIGCSFEERAGFQQINVEIFPDMEDASSDEIASWIEETEARCPVTDNIRAGTNLTIEIASSKE